MEDLNFELEEKVELLPGNNNQIKFYRKTGTKVLVLFWLNISMIGVSIIGTLAIFPVILPLADTWTGSVRDQVKLLAAILVYFIVFLVIMHCIYLAVGIIILSLGSADTRFTFAGVACIAGQVIGLIGNGLQVFLGVNEILLGVFSIITGLLSLGFIYFFISGMEDLVSQASNSTAEMWSTYRKFYLITIGIYLISTALMFLPHSLALIGLIGLCVGALIGIILVVAWYILLFKSGRAMRNYL